MTLELEIQKLTEAVEDLAFIMKQVAVMQSSTKHEQEEKQVVQKLVENPEPVKVAVKTVDVEPPKPPEMPAPPAFLAPTLVPTPTVTAPFNDAKGLVEYLISAYHKLGAEKGEKIQAVYVGLGYQNVNDIKPEHYGAVFAGVEALK